MNFFSKDFLLACTGSLILTFVCARMLPHALPLHEAMLLSLLGLLPWCLFRKAACSEHHKLYRRIMRRDRRIRSWHHRRRQAEEARLSEELPLLLTDASGRIQRASMTAIRLIGKDPSGSFISQFPGATPGRQGVTFTTHTHPAGKHLLCWLPLTMEDRSWRLGFDLTPCMERELRLNAEAETSRRLAEQRADSLMVADRRLQELSQMATLGRMAAGISHDFNNILSAILGAAQMAGLLRDEGRRDHHLNTILAAGHRARDLVQQILHFSRPEAAAFRNFSLKPIVAESLRFIRASLPAHIALRCRNGAPEACIHGNPTRIHQLLINLMTNACHAMEDNGGILSLDIHPVEPHRLRITVRDTGHGIPESIREKIFEPFFTTRNPGEGNGMGLALVQEVVREHGGHLSLESEAGAGAIFRVDLPLLIRSAKAEVRKTEILQGSGHVLLVEDEENLRLVFLEMLERLGCTAYATGSAREALDWMRDHPMTADLALLDYAMPGMHGLALADSLRAIRPELPLIFTTGCPHWLRGRAAGATLLAKPFTLQDLSLALKRARAPEASASLLETA